MAKKQKKFPKQLSLESKRFLIIDMISKGMKYTDIMKACMTKWGLREKTVEKYISDAIDFMQSEDTMNALKSANIQRLDDLFQQSKKSGDTKNAIRAIDTQNKMIGAYEEKVKIESDSEIQFVFNVNE